MFVYMVISFHTVASRHVADLTFRLFCKRLKIFPLIFVTYDFKTNT